MQIGDMRIDAVLDGEAAVPPDSLYVDVGLEEWEPHKHHLDPCTGLQLNTLGGFLVRYDDKAVLVDTGIGPKPTFPFVGGAMRSALWALDVSPLDITDIIFTHLHIDHIGWTTIDGKPFFPNATIRLDKRDWDHFTASDYQTPDWEAAVSDPHADPVPVRLGPVQDRMEFFVGDAGVLPGIEAIESSGHTPGSTVLKLSSRGEVGMLIGDLVHTQPELIEDRWDFAIHIDSEKAMDSIERIRKHIYDNDIPFAAAHFPGMKWGKLTMNDGRLGYKTIAG